jgi:hypothetical protein
LGREQKISIYQEKKKIEYKIDHLRCELNGADDEVGWILLHCQLQILEMVNLYSMVCKELEILEYHSNLKMGKEKCIDHGKRLNSFSNEPKLTTTIIKENQNSFSRTHYPKEIPNDYKLDGHYDSKYEITMISM